jgi:hypothetical protein
MKTIFDVNDNEVIEHFRKQNLQKEDYNDVFDVPEFLRNIPTKTTFESVEKSNLESENFQIDFDDDDFEEEIDRYDIELPYGYQEIELYDNQKTFDENFEKGKRIKYILIGIDSDKNFSIGSMASVIPTPQTKCIIDIEKVEDYSSLEIIPVDYDSFFGLRLLSFQKYKSDFFLCDERVMFETFLIKYQRFDFKPFYWSLNKVFEEVGIKKDRASAIIEKFIKLGIASKKLVKTQIENRPQQINYYDLNIDRIIELIPEIYLERDSVNLETEIRKYLIPVLKKK